MAHISRLPLLFSLLCLTASAGCSGPNPNKFNSKENMQPSPDVQKLMAELGGPNVGSLEETLKNSAKQAIAAHNYKSAAQLYAQLIEKNPNENAYKFAHADALRRAGHYDEAIIAFKKLLGDPKYGLDALEGLGLAYMEDGDFDEAGDALAEVMEKDPKRWQTINAIGILFTTKQMYPEARQYFDEALHITPQNISVSNNMALMEALDKNYDEAIRLLQDAMQIAGKRSSQIKPLAMNLALVYAIKGELHMAEATIEPHLTESQKLNNMGFYAKLQGDDPLAKSYLSMALTKSEKYYDKAWKNLETLGRLRNSAPGGQVRKNH
jgi:Flp pilus assembly protein TadD